MLLKKSSEKEEEKYAREACPLARVPASYYHLAHVLK
jgi:hypothetical protein